MTKDELIAKQQLQIEDYKLVRIYKRNFNLSEMEAKKFRIVMKPKEFSIYLLCGKIHCLQDNKHD